MTSWTHPTFIRSTDRDAGRRRRRRTSGLLSACLTASSLAVATVATASNIAEFQLEASRVLSRIRAEAASHEFCIEPFACPIGQGNCLVDHLEFPDAATLRHRPGAPVSVVVSPAITVVTNPVQAVVPITVFLKELDCAEDPQCADAVPVPIDLVLDLSGASGSLCVSIGGIEPTFPGVDSVVFDLQSNVGTVCLGGSLTDALKPLLGSGHTVTGGGVSANAAGTRIALRTEFDNGSSQAEWNSFFGGTIAPAAPQKNWSVFLDQAFLRSVAVEQSSAAISAADGVTLDGTPSSSWLPAVPGFSIQASGDKDVDDCAVDVAFDLTLDGSFTLGSTSLDMHIAADAETSTWDAFWCFASNPFPKSDVVQLFTSLLYEILTAEDLQISSEGLPPSCETNGTDIDCSFPLNLPTGFTVDTLAGNSAGLVLAGTAPVTPAPQPVSAPDIDLTPITYGVYGGCNSLHFGFEGDVFVSGPGKLCAAYVLSDPLQLFDVDAPASGSLLPVDMPLFFVNDFGSPYFALGGAYAPDLAIRTSRGARALSIPKVKLPSKNDQQAAVFGMLLAKLNCMASHPKRGLADFVPNWEDPGWGARVWPGQVMTREGRPEDVSVSLSDQVIRLLPIERYRIGKGGKLELPQQAAVLMATATLEGERLGRVEVPVEIPMMLDLSGRLQKSGKLQLELVHAATVAARIEGADLPGSIAALSFSMELPSKAFKIKGKLGAT
jgi:hypothetical protein